MFIVLGYYKRRADITHAQYSRHWRDVHGPLIRAIGEKNPGLLLRYVQHHLEPDSDYPEQPGITPGSAGFDGFSEAWFASKDARDKYFSIPWFQNEGLEDEKQFIDISATRWAVLDQQHTIIPGDAGLIETYMRKQATIKLG